MSVDNSHDVSRRAFLKLGLASAGTFALRNAFAACPGVGNPVTLENLKAGADWLLTRYAAGGEIMGYANATSINRGSRISFFVHCVDPQYRIEVFRLGWYGGAGARLVKAAVTRPGVRQPMPTPDPTTGLIECRWGAPYSLSTTRSADPTVWPSGYYLARLTSVPGGYQSYVPFVVRDDSRIANYLFQQSATTYAAYNMWGGKNLYGGSGGRAYKVSFNRPYDDCYGAGQLWLAELQMIRWLEREGYDVKYCANVDTHTYAPSAWNARAWLTVGHDEYWSWQMRTNVEAARELGIDLGFFCANTCYRAIRLEASPYTGAAARTVVCYKEDGPDPYLNDPAKQYLVTTQYWRTAPISRPEGALLGVQYDDALFSSSGDIVVSNAGHWIFAGTGLRDGDRFIGLLNGREVDRIYPDVAPAGLETLCSSPVTVGGYPADPTHSPSHVTLYTWPASGAMVFAAGTITWSYGLDDFGRSWRGDVPVQPGMQLMMANLLKRFAGC